MIRHITDRRFGMAVELFRDVHDISEGKRRVYGLIKIINRELPPHYLNKLCLWEDKYGTQYIKVFDCAKDLAESISTKYQLVLGGNEIVKGKWPNTNWYEYFYGISLVPERRDEHSINVGCPRLAVLQLQLRKDSQSTLVDISKGMKGLMVQSLDVRSLPESLNVLCNLRTLRLNILKLEDLSRIGFLMNLKLLSISTSSLTEIPREMGQLGNLRSFDLRGMSIAYIPPGVLSRMLKLEELNFPLSFQWWGCRAKELDDYDSNNQIKRINASISEITSLSLHALEISIPNTSVFPKNSSVFEKIRQFNFRAK